MSSVRQNLYALKPFHVLVSNNSFEISAWVTIYFASSQIT